MEEYFDLRNRADAMAANGYKEEAVALYNQAIEILPQTRFSEQQRKLIKPLLERRRDRVANS